MWVVQTLVIGVLLVTTPSHSQNLGTVFKGLAEGLFKLNRTIDTPRNRHAVRLATGITNKLSSLLNKAYKTDSSQTGPISPAQYLTNLKKIENPEETEIYSASSEEDYIFTDSQGYYNRNNDKANEDVVVETTESSIIFDKRQLGGGGGGFGGQGGNGGYNGGGQNGFGGANNGFNGPNGPPGGGGFGGAQGGSSGFGGGGGGQGGYGSQQGLGGPNPNGPSGFGSQGGNLGAPGFGAGQSPGFGGNGAAALPLPYGAQQGYAALQNNMRFQPPPGFPPLPSYGAIPSPFGLGQTASPVYGGLPEMPSPFVTPYGLPAYPAPAYGAPAVSHPSYWPMMSRLNGGIPPGYGALGGLGGQRGFMPSMYYPPGRPVGMTGPGPPQPYSYSPYANYFRPSQQMPYGGFNTGGLGLPGLSGLGRYGLPSAYPPHQSPYGRLHRLKRGHEKRENTVASNGVATPFSGTKLPISHSDSPSPYQTYSTRIETLKPAPPIFGDQNKDIESHKHNEEKPKQRTEWKASKIVHPKIHVNAGTNPGFGRPKDHGRPSYGVASPLLNHASRPSPTPKPKQRIQPIPINKPRSLGGRHLGHFATPTPQNYDFQSVQNKLRDRHTFTSIHVPAPEGPVSFVDRSQLASQIDFQDLTDPGIPVHINNDVPVPFSAWEREKGLSNALNNNPFLNYAAADNNLVAKTPRPSIIESNPFPPYLELITPRTEPQSTTKTSIPQTTPVTIAVTPRPVYIVEELDTAFHPLAHSESRAIIDVSHEAVVKPGIPLRIPDFFVPTQTSIIEPQCQCLDVDLRKFLGPWIQIYGNPFSLGPLRSDFGIHGVTNSSARIKPACIGLHLGKPKDNDRLRSQSRLRWFYRDGGNRIHQEFGLVKSIGGGKLDFTIGDDHRQVCVMKTGGPRRALYSYLVLTETDGPNACRALHVLARDALKFYHDFNSEVVNYLREEVEAGRVDPIGSVTSPELCELGALNKRFS